MISTCPQPPIGTDDRALVAACLACEEGAFAALMTAHRPGIVRLARAHVGPHDVEDVCQDIYLRVFVRLNTFGHRSRLATWIYRVAVNVIRNRQRHARRRRFDAHVPIDDLCLRERWRALVHASTPASLFEASDRARRVRQAIRALPSAERRALTLWTYRDASLSTIARSTGRSAAGARRSLRRARDGIRAAWMDGRTF